MGVHNNFSSLRDVSYAFDMRAMSIDFYQMKYEHGHDNIHPIHEESTDILLHEWKKQLFSFCKLPLRRLQLSFEECYCPMGCCRLVRLLMGELADLLIAKSQFPKVIELITWKEDIEGQLAHSSFKGDFEGHPVEVRLMTKSKWE
ncbi:hypothetical protein F4781DRAFT_416252 [Annulohypoxylon bovei var. microspora]|nr:hypothetical protein F4781DRAFT_416252 [Annulohypoxylon bovei var. microspora]